MRSFAHGRWALLLWLPFTVDVWKDHRELTISFEWLWSVGRRSWPAWPCPLVDSWSFGPTEVRRLNVNPPA